MGILFVIETVQLHEFQKLEQAQRRSVMPKGMMKVDTTHAHILRTRLLWKLLSWLNEIADVQLKENLSGMFSAPCEKYASMFRTALTEGPSERSLVQEKNQCRRRDSNPFPVKTISRATCSARLAILLAEMFIFNAINVAT